ncbi:hypothetical protein BJP34_34845 [Moorena producens PAL-8-15-08-1]|uniref:Uncharacterized protein n=1 Tax=Moorena producens PAL-8-15-08-1 TaxID=1458985 RepID=A0A1D8U203_9CYAN|nr:hypothetical protein BJP34_34845 [Moorena producens PAL-8-15-08-1]
MHLIFVKKKGKCGKCGAGAREFSREFLPNCKSEGWADLRGFPPLALCMADSEMHPGNLRGYLPSFLILNFAPLAPQFWGEQESICG